MTFDDLGLTPAQVLAMVTWLVVFLAIGIGATAVAINVGKWTWRRWRARRRP